MYVVSVAIAFNRSHNSVQQASQIIHSQLVQTKELLVVACLE